MRVFLTGATGFIGSYLVPELISGGHQVLGLTRSEAGARTLERAGAQAFHGDLMDLGRLRAAAAASDGVIHAAFDHDFGKLKENSENDRRVIGALGEALAGSNRPFVISSGTGLARRSQKDRPALEADDHVTSAEFPRAATEEAADTLVAAGGRVMILRLSQVHDIRHQGRIAQHIRIARQKGRVAYVGAGDNRLSAVHVSDAVRLYGRALERGKAGERYNAVGEEGVTLRDIADVLGAGLRLPVVSITPDEAEDYFGPIAPVAQLDLAASSAWTRRRLDWETFGPDLLSDLREMDYSAI
jgi:nucleoside-diphosphate-sugar epimerase